jgi:hypothetical protein
VGKGLPFSGQQASHIDLRLDDGPTAMGEPRAAVDRAAEDCGLDAAERFDLKLAATEAAAGSRSCWRLSTRWSSPRPGTARVCEQAGHPVGRRRELANGDSLFG